MKLNAKMRVALKLAAVFGTMTVVAVVVLVQVTRVENSLADFPAQLGKITAVNELHHDLLAQAHCIKAYMLYEDEYSLQEFRRLAHANESNLEGLLGVVRDSRKDLVREILSAQRTYTGICEGEIIPLVQHGNAAGAVRVGEPASGPLGVLLQRAEELRTARLEDTSQLVDSAMLGARQTIYGSVGLLFLLVVMGIGTGTLVARKVALENTVYRLVLANSRNGIIIVGTNGRLQTVNRVAEDIFQVRREQVLGRRFADVFTGREQSGEVAFHCPVAEMISGGDDLCNGEMVYVAPDGWRYMLLVDCLQLREGGRSQGIVLIFRDITERKVIEERLRGLAVRDSMTLLYNHRYLKESLSREVAQASDQGENVAFLLLDVDNFKGYNDAFGHPAGDELLKRLAGVLRRQVRDGDVVARYGGDEFAVILPRAGREEAVDVGERIRQAVASYAFPHRDLLPGEMVTVSVGAACYPDDAADAGELVKRADEAMYNAKCNAKNRVEAYFSSFNELQEDWPGEQHLLYNVRGLLSMVNSKDRYTYGHSERVAHYAAGLAEAVGLKPHEVKRIKLAAFLHDIGKVEVPADVLNKAGPLTADERRLVQRHPVTGAGIVGEIESLQDIVPAILHHHERFDGRGYPAGLAGPAIPLAARIIAVADSYDAMTSERPYRPALNTDKAVKEIRKEAGGQFDPQLADIFINKVIIQGGLCRECAGAAAV